MKNDDVKKVLLINFGGIGDEILFFPTIKSVKQTYPNAKIYLALEKRSKSAKHLCPYIDKVFCLDIKSKYKKYFEIVKFLFKVWIRNFDVVISALSYVQSAINDDDPAMKRAVTSLYRYYTSTMTYRDNRPETYGGGE